MLCFLVPFHLHFFCYHIRVHCDTQSAACCLSIHLVYDMFLKNKACPRLPGSKVASVTSYHKLKRFGFSDIVLAVVISLTFRHHRGLFDEMEPEHELLASMSVPQLMKLPRRNPEV